MPSGVNSANHLKQQSQLVTYQFCDKAMFWSTHLDGNVYIWIQFHKYVNPVSVLERCVLNIGLCIIMGQTIKYLYEHDICL